MLPLAASEQYRIQQAIAATTASALSRIWGRMGDDFDESLASLRPQMLQTLQAGRVATVNRAVGYTEAVTTELGFETSPVGAIEPARFLENTPDGRSLDTLVDQAAVQAKVAVRDGAVARVALETASGYLTTATLTMLADTRRDVYSADIISRPTLTGYVRMLNPPSCSRCAILAGKWYRWNQGFQRHPRCDCQHIPAPEDAAGDLRTDPYEYFNSLDREAQDRLFTKQGARAIRDGGDIYRVENIRMRGLSTSKQGRKYGTPHRRTVDDIYAIAGNDRARAIKLLTDEGYITGPQTRGGNIVGAYRERYAGMTSVPRAGSARERVLRARQTGVRDPLDPATMTAAERRLYDDFYRLYYARKHGQIPRSIGLNSADVAANASGTAVSRQRLADMEQALQRKLARIGSTDTSLKQLASSLGLTESDDFRSQIVFDRIEELNRQRFFQATRQRRR